MGSVGKRAEMSTNTPKFNNQKEIANYIQEKYGIKWQSSMSKLSLPFQQSIAEQMDRVFTEFPQATDYVTSIGTRHNSDTFMGLMHGGNKDGMLVIDDMYSRYDMANPTPTNGGFSVDYHHQLISHELGHAVARALGANAEYRAFKQGNVDTSKLVKISKYANDMNTGERYAEAMGDYFIHGNRANSESIKVARATKELLEKKK